jgi:hypothetical protein
MANGSAPARETEAEERRVVKDTEKRQIQAQHFAFGDEVYTK